MQNIINVMLVANSIIVVALVLINQPETGEVFGNKDSFLRTRRGMEKNMHYATILFSATLVLLAIVNQILG